MYALFSCGFSFDPYFMIATASQYGYHQRSCLLWQGINGVGLGVSRNVVYCDSFNVTVAQSLYLGNSKAAAAHVACRPSVPVHCKARNE